MAASIAPVGVRPTFPQAFAQDFPQGASAPESAADGPESKPDASRGPAYIVGSAAELNAKLRAQALDLIGAPGNPGGAVTIGADGVEKRRVRDAGGRVFEERRMRDPKTGRTLFLELSPTDGMGGKVSILAGNKAATVSFSERDIGKVPFDLVGRALGEIMKEQGLQAGDSFNVSMRVLP
jgi:hypothetical protein